MLETNQRITREQEFHDRRFGDDSIRQKKVSKFYQITNSIKNSYKQKILANCQELKVIEYGCGKGSYAFDIAKQGAKLVTGIDISPVAINMAEEEAKSKEIDEQASFKVMNAENLEFAPNSYDLICGSGILHHLNLNLAINSIDKVLKPDGKAIFLEPLGHNILINLYRRLTPSIRSEDEHPLLDRDLVFLGQHFKQVNIQYFYLTSLAASFLVGKPGFNMVLKSLELLDSVLLKLPFIKKQAWLVLIELSEPIK